MSKISIEIEDLLWKLYNEVTFRHEDPVTFSIGEIKLHYSKEVFFECTDLRRNDIQKLFPICTLSGSWGCSAFTAKLQVQRNDQGMILSTEWCLDGSETTLRDWFLYHKLKEDVRVHPYSDFQRVKELPTFMQSPQVLAAPLNFCPEIDEFISWAGKNVSALAQGFFYEIENNNQLQSSESTRFLFWISPLNLDCTGRYTAVSSTSYVGRNIQKSVITDYPTAMALNWLIVAKLRLSGI